jgi:hypothetical protein
MKHIYLLLATCTILSCSPDPETFIPYINGYWEIDKVKLHNGNNRDYNYNDTIDYFELNDSLIGFRKKLKPNFMGTYATSKDSEKIKVVLENDSLNLYYSTPFSSWKETVLLATNEHLKIINQNKDVYLYKRYQPLNLE